MSAGISNAKQVHPLQQFQVLLRHCFLPDRMYLLFQQLIFASIAGFLIGWGLQGQWINLSVFLVILTATWLGAHISMQDVLLDFPSFCRERRTGISPTAYFFSKFFCNASITLLQCFFLLVLSCPFLGLIGIAPLLLLICWGSSLSGVGIGFLIGSLIKRKCLAQTALRVAILLALIFGNLLRPYDNLNASIRGSIGFVPIRWGYDKASFIVDAKYGDSLRHPMRENGLSLLKPLQQMSPLYEDKKEIGFGWYGLLTVAVYILCTISIIYFLFYVRVLFLRE